MRNEEGAVATSMAAIINVLCYLTFPSCRQPDNVRSTESTINKCSCDFDGGWKVKMGTD